MNTPMPPAGWEDPLYDEEEDPEKEDYRGRPVPYLLKEYKAEMVVRASINGRKLTLDPIREKVLDIPWREVESVIPCGFQMPWIDGEYNGEPFLLTAGASAGSRWMTFSYKGHGYCISAADIVKRLIEFAEETE